MFERNCDYCRKIYSATSNSSMYCSNSCRVYISRERTGGIVNRKCKNCSETYRTPVNSGRFCSKVCKEQHAKKVKKSIKNCNYCLKPFNGHYNAKYCSMKCKDAYKVRKPLGITEKCVVCSKLYELTASKRKNKEKVCSVKCSNLLTSKFGKDVSIDFIIFTIKSFAEQPTSTLVADTIGISHTMLSNKAKEYCGSYRELVKIVRGTYKQLEDEGRSLTATGLFHLIDSIYSVQGVREKTFSDLRNPLTNYPLRLDYYLEDLPIAIEYMGSQHFTPNEFFHSSANKKHKNNIVSFKAQQFRDQYKAKYLAEKGIPFVIFTFKDELSEGNIRLTLNKYLN